MTRRCHATDWKFRKGLGSVFCMGIGLFFLLFGEQAHAEQRSVAHRPSREITDEIGRKIQIPERVNRVVSLAPNLTEIVFAIGDGDHLAGDTDYCDYPPQALQKPHVGGMINPSLEAVASLMPDLVLATKSINRRETVEALSRIGLPVYVVEDPHTLEEMITSIEHIGAALGLEKSAAMIAGDLRARLASLDRRLSGVAPRRVLFVVWPNPLISVGRGTFIADAMRRAGGRSIVETSAEWPVLSLEEIVRLQPEFLVFASAHAGDTRQDIEALRARPGWRDLTAIEQGRIVVVSEAINRPAPRIVDAIEQLARELHPEAFPAGRAPSAESYSLVEEACACAR